MTSENMMSELRRIVGTFVEQRKRAVAEAAKEGAKTARPAEKAAAYALGKADGIGRVLEELTQTFGVDPWSCEVKEGAAAAI